MGLFLQFERARGVRLWRRGHSQAELWYCPRGYTIPEHVHDEMASRITFLGGRMLFRRDDRTLHLDWRRLFRTFTVARGQRHGATVTGRFGLFLNHETWLTTTPTSASHDFRRT